MNTASSQATSHCTTAPHPLSQRHGSLVTRGLWLGALGVVFGDIGTSPLYAMRECLTQVGNTAPGLAVLGSLSLIIWALIFEVCIKYLGNVMKAGNQGEGGIFALLALRHAGKKGAEGAPGLLTLLILFGAALLCGDGVITPAISVLGAAEGLKGLHPWFNQHIVPVACVILLLLFLFQQKGTHSIGRVFGPVMMIWFTVIGGLGVLAILENPAVLRALNPWYGVQLLKTAPLQAGAILGAVVLAITGAEALYADMGHFGRKHISRAWYCVAFPCLVLNYLGQGAHILSHPADLDQLFFSLAPDGLPRMALVGLSIAAAVIASQALISGTFSLTRQAIQLGYFPRLKIIHTNATQEGQIYIPLINATLAIGSILVVLGFKSSDALASAYGVAVTGTMLITTIAYLDVTRNLWHWPIWKSWVPCIFFVLIEAVFLAANFHKFAEGAWLPLLLAAGIIVIMHTWKMGRLCILALINSDATRQLDIDQVCSSKAIHRVDGCAVFMVANPQGIPLSLLHHLKVNRCLQKTVVLLSIINEERPHVKEEHRLQVTAHANGIWRAIGHYGYMESPDISALCDKIRECGVPMQVVNTSFFFNREMIITGGPAPMWEWQKGLYAFLSRNARPVKDYYKVQPTQIIEIGLPLHL